MARATRFVAQARATARTEVGAPIAAATSEYVRVSPAGMSCRARHTRAWNAVPCTSTGRSGRRTADGEGAQRAHDVDHGRIVPLQGRVRELGLDLGGQLPLLADADGGQAPRRRDRDDVADGSAGDGPEQHLLGRAGDVVRGRHAEASGGLLVEAPHRAVPGREGGIEHGVGGPQRRPWCGRCARPGRTAWA